MASCFGETEHGADRYSEPISVNSVMPGFDQKNLHKSDAFALSVNDFDVISTTVAKLYIPGNLTRVFIYLVLSRPTCSALNKKHSQLAVSLQDFRSD